MRKITIEVDCGEIDCEMCKYRYSSSVPRERWCGVFGKMLSWSRNESRTRCQQCLDAEEGK